MENENELNENDGGKLRKLYEDSLKKNKEMSDRLAAMEARERTSSVEKALSDKGLNPKLAKFVPAEDGSDPARLDTWIKENSELFGTPASAEETPGGQSSVDLAAQAEFAKIQQVSQNGTHAVSDVAALQAQIRNTKTPAELDALMANLAGKLGG